jgi:hypothetical protein
MALNQDSTRFRARHATAGVHWDRPRRVCRPLLLALRGPSRRAAGMRGLAQHGNPAHSAAARPTRDRGPGARPQRRRLRGACGAPGSLRRPPFRPDGTAPRRRRARRRGDRSPELTCATSAGWRRPGRSCDGTCPGRATGSRRRGMADTRQAGRGVGSGPHAAQGRGAQAASGICGADGSSVPALRTTPRACNAAIWSAS